jgi:hypothetical protein
MTGVRVGEKDRRRKILCQEIRVADGHHLVSHSVDNEDRLTDFLKIGDDLKFRLRLNRIQQMFM